jgi:hypothetical protein
MRFTGNKYITFSLYLCNNYHSFMQLNTVDFYTLIKVITVMVPYQFVSDLEQLKKHGTCSQRAQDQSFHTWILPVPCGGAEEEEAQTGAAQSKEEKQGNISQG